MARKLSEEERNHINFLTSTLVAALPAHLRSHAGAIASSLVRIPREVVTARDINRIVGRIGEHKDELKEAIREHALVSVEVPEGGVESFVLRAPEVGEEVAEESEAAVEAAAGAAAEVAPEEPAAAAEKPEEKAAQGEAPEASESVAPEQSAAAEPAAEAKPTRRRRTRRSRKKVVEETSEAAPAEQPVALEPAAAEPEVAAAVEASEPAVGEPAVSEPAEAAPEAPAAAAPATEAAPAAEPASAPEAPAEPEAPAAQQQRSSRGSRGRGRRGGSSNNKQREPERQTLAEVPYIRRGGEAEAELRQRIVGLDQRFWVNGWLLSHPGAFALYENELVGLNDALANGMLPGDVTRRQLAYQMGGDEKFFEYGNDGFKLLRAMGVEDLIRHRPLPKADVLYHAPRRRKHMRVLVTENLDPWLDVRDLMYEEGRSTILGERIHAVVLGGGMPVLENNRLHLLLDTLGADSYEVLYWGDIDRAGLDILCRLRALLEGKFDVKAFTPAYQLMCDRAMARFPDPASNEKTGQVNIEVADTSVICAGLTPEAAAYAEAVIANCGLVPQEILTKRDL